MTITAPWNPNPLQIAIVAHDVRTFQYDPRLAARPARDYQRELTQALENEVPLAMPGERLQIALATGGGKTRVLNDFIFNYATRMGAKILVVAPDWELIAQQVNDACARHPHARDIITFVGGAGAEGKMFGAPCSAQPQVWFTTIQTAWARRHSDFAALDFDVVMLDEVHYGETGKLQAALYARYKATSVFVGATATPRAGSKFRVVGPVYDLEGLVERGILARPFVSSIETRVQWNPSIDGTAHDFAATSLNELARNKARNEIIVASVADNISTLAPALVFAINIEHAELLARQLRAAGIRAAATHSRQSADERDRLVTAFRKGELDALVNVNALTTGVDLPNTMGIVLAKPTMSDIRLTQQIGRGSRCTPTKDHFYVVDLVDNIVGPNGAYVKRPHGYFGSPQTGRARRAKHEYIPSQLVTIADMSSPMNGFSVQPSQTFQIEFTLEARTNVLKAANVIEQIVRELPNAVNTTACATDGASWAVACVGEQILIRSPLFAGADELSLMAKNVDHIGVVAARDGYGIARGVPVHAHMAWCPEAGHLTALVNYFGYFEPALASVAPPPDLTLARPMPARRASRDVTQLKTTEDWFEYMDRAGTPFQSLDLTPLFSQGWAIDVPFYTDMLNGEWMAAWVSLAMHIMRAAEEGRPLKGNPLRRVQSLPITRGARGRIEELCNLVGAPPRLMNLLLRQREALLKGEWLVHPRFGSLARRVGESWQLSA